MFKTLLIGHLGRDADSNSVNGKTVLNFPVAHTDKYNDQQGNPQRKTVWTRCALWTDKTAILPYLKKGTQVFVEGQSEAKSYKRSDGTQDVVLQMRVNRIQLLGSSSPRQQNGQAHLENDDHTPPPPSPASESEYPAAVEGVAEPLEELPF
jgi:single-strand DNA-binding protein